MDQINKEKESQIRIEGNAFRYKLIANVKMEYHLDPKYVNDYRLAVSKIKNYKEFYDVLDLFVDKYVWTFTNGITTSSVTKEQVSNIFKIDFIEAERTNASIYEETRREMNRYIKDDQNLGKIKGLEKSIAELVKEKVSEVLKRIDGVITNEQNEIGLERGNISIAQDIRPKAAISESYVIDVKDTEQGYTLPVTHNGVGYNNLVNIYMLIKLTELQKGNDARILCLEEPEAHLHPAMQYKLFSYLRKLDEEDDLKQQIFVTTHSSNITAVAGIDNMYMFAYKRDREDGYDCVYQRLENQFEIDCDTTDVELDQQAIEERNNSLEVSKMHLMKFLDVTRSDMLFANNIILVEGLAEKLLIPKFMDKLGCSYEDEHTSIVEIGGKHFEYFVDIYAGNPIGKKVLCITDNDFVFIETDEDNNKYVKPIQEYYNMEKPKHVKKIEERYLGQENIKLVYQKDQGRTFEDELFLANFESSEIAKKLLKLVMSEKFFELIDNHDLKIDIWKTKIKEIDGRSTKKVNAYLSLYETAMLSDERNKEVYEKLFFAKLFLYYAEGKKGDVALAILTDESLIGELVVPSYIERGLTWLQQ